MVRRRDRTTEIRALAQTLSRLIREREAVTTQRVKITPSLSRILRHDPEWRGPRLRTEAAAGRLAKDPSFSTVVELARQLDVPLCALHPTDAHHVMTKAQQKVLTLTARWALANFAEREDERAVYRNDIDDFEPYRTVEKLEVQSGAGRVGIDEQLTAEVVEVLDSIPLIKGEHLQVTTVRGDSMRGILSDGDRVLVDVERRSPRKDDIVVVDRAYLGRTIGYWRREGNRFLLDKQNDETIDLGSPDDFTILGTVRGILWSPLRGRPLMRITGDLASFQGAVDERHYGTVSVIANWPEITVHGASDPRDEPAYVELFLHDLFLLRNLSEPGSCGGSVTVGRRTLTFDPRLFTGAPLPLAEVVAWYDGLGIGTRQIAESAEAIALFELLTLSRREEDELESIVRLSRAAEALGLALPRLFALRGEIATAPAYHPMHDDALDPRVEDATREWVEVADAAARAVVEAFGERIRHHARP